MQSFLILLVMSVCLVACGDRAMPAAQVSGPLGTPLATYTPAPTYTPYPTYTALPTLTPYPTYTHVPTATMRPATSTMTPAPAATQAPAVPTPTETMPPNRSAMQTTVTPDGRASDVRIVYIFFDGEKGRTEPDEYCEIRNVGAGAVNLDGWRLNAGAPGQDFRFSAFELQPEQVIRVYTNEMHTNYGGFSFTHSETALWANAGDCGYLYDAGGDEVSRYCY